MNYDVEMQENRLPLKSICGCFVKELATWGGVCILESALQTRSHGSVTLIVLCPVASS